MHTFLPSVTGRPIAVWGGQVINQHQEVKVMVRPGLGAEEGVNSPAAHDPTADVVVTRQGEHIEGFPH